MSPTCRPSCGGLRVYVCITFLCASVACGSAHTGAPDAQSSLEQPIELHGGTALDREGETWTGIDAAGRRAGPQPSSLRQYYEEESLLAAALCEEIARIEADPAYAASVAELLADASGIFAGDPAVPANVRSVTVRDAAFTILEESGVIRFERSVSAKLIAGCELDGEWTRLRIPVLDEEDFTRSRAALDGRTAP